MSSAKDELENLEFLEGYSEAKEISLEEAKQHQRQLHPDWLAYLEEHRKPSFKDLYQKKAYLWSAIGLIVVVLFFLLKGNPEEEQMKSLEAQVSGLESRLIKIESNPPIVSDGQKFVVQLRQIQNDVKSFDSKVEELISEKKEEEVKGQRAQVSNLQKMVSGIVEASQNPPVKAGEGAIKARQILEGYQGLQEKAESFEGEYGSSFDSPMALRYETLEEGINSGIRRSALLLKPKGSDGKPVIDPIAKEVNQEIAQLLKKIDEYKAPIPPPPPPMAPFPENEATLVIASTKYLSVTLVKPLLESKYKMEVKEFEGKWYCGNEQTDDKVLVRLPVGNEFDELFAEKIDVLISGIPKRLEAQVKDYFTKKFGDKAIKENNFNEVIALDALTFSMKNGDGKKEISTNKISNNSFKTAGVNSSAASYANLFNIKTDRNANQNIQLTTFHENQTKENNAPLLSVKVNNDISSVPDRFNISTENYPYVVRISAWNIPKSNPEVSKFVDFAKAKEGQAVVKKTNYVNLTPEAGGVGDPPPDNILGALRELFPDKKININKVEQLATSIRFETDSSEFDFKARTDVIRVKSYIDANFENDGKIGVAILGHADNQGNADYNIGLSTKRANKVMQYIRGTIDDMSVKGLGENEPIDTNETEEGRAKNRRAEIWIVEFE